MSKPKKVKYKLPKYPKLILSVSVNGDKFFPITTYDANASCVDLPKPSEN